MQFLGNNDHQRYSKRRFITYRICQKREKNQSVSNRWILSNDWYSLDRYSISFELWMNKYPNKENRILVEYWNWYKSIEISMNISLIQYNWWWWMMDSFRCERMNRRWSGEWDLLYASVVPWIDRFDSVEVIEQRSSLMNECHHRISTNLNVDKGRRWSERLYLSYLIDWKNIVDQNSQIMSMKNDCLHSIDRIFDSSMCRTKAEIIKFEFIW